MEKKIKLPYFAHGVQQAKDQLADGVIKFTDGTGAVGGVVGLSGGVDSSTVAYLCQYAFDREKQRTGKNLTLYGVIMPSQANSPDDERDARMVSENLGIESFVIPIEPLAESFVSVIPGITSEFDRGNLYSEMRAVVLSRIAALKNVRVMGTGNRDEDYVLGYFTKRGDGAVDNNILGNLSKRLVRELACHLQVPNDLVGRVSTAGLWVGQTDEEELGYSYDQAELVQEGFDQDCSSEEIEEITGINARIIRDVQERHSFSEHKRNTPPIGKVELSYRV